MKRLARTLFVTAMGTLCGIANAAVITFDDLGLTPSESQVIGTSPVNVGSGFVMSRSLVEWGADGRLIDATDTGNSYNSGGNPSFSYLAAKNSWQPLSTRLAQADGLGFSLLGFDFHGWNNNKASQIDVTGHLVGGGIISTSFILTNTFSAPYQHASLSTAWTNLASVEFSSPLPAVGVFQLDNISVESVAQVPEPASAALLGLGLLGFAAVRKRKQLN